MIHYDYWKEIVLLIKMLFLSLLYITVRYKFTVIVIIIIYTLL